MTLPLLALLVAFAWLLFRRGQRRLAAAAGGLAAVLFLAIGCGLAPMVLLRLWQAPYAERPPLAWGARNAIVLLTAGMSELPQGTIEPGGSAYGRIVEAVILYRDCVRAGVHCTVLLSGGDALHVGEPLATTYVPTFRALGVPARDLVLERHSMTTWGNARRARLVLRRIGTDRVWLVTSGLHLRRAELAFDLFGIARTPVRADYPHAVWSLWPLGVNVALTDAVLHEMVGDLAYRLYAWSGRARREMRADDAQAGLPAPSLSVR